MTEEQETNEEKEKTKKKNKKFGKKLRKLSKWQLFLAVICFVAGIVLVVIQKNNSDYRVDDFFASSSMNLGEAFYKHYYWPNYGVGMWSSVFTFISAFILFYGLRENFHRSLVVVHIASSFVSISMEFSSFVIAARIAGLYPETYNHLAYLIMNVVVSVLCFTKMILLIISVVTGFNAVPNCFSFASTQLNKRYKNVEAQQSRMQILQPPMTNQPPQVMMTNRGPVLAQHMTLTPMPPTTSYPMGTVPPPEIPPPSYSTQQPKYV